MTELTQLLGYMRDDEMALRDVELPTGEVVYLKSLVEAYPGVASIHALRGAPRGPVCKLVLASTRELAGELDALLLDLAREIDGLTWKRSAPAAVREDAAVPRGAADLQDAAGPTAAREDVASDESGE